MKLNRIPIFRLILLLATSAVAFAQEQPFYLKQGDRVVFYGDSITDQRLYTTFTETYVLTRFPHLNVTFVHSGWGGDRVSGGGGGGIEQRLERDVFAYHPNVMTIMLGMNDGSYRALDEPIFEKYRSGYEHIIQSVKEKLPGIKLTLIEPSPFDDVTQPPRFEGGYNKVLVRYGEFVRDLAKREQCQDADLNAPIVAALEKAYASDTNTAKKIIPDRVHPGPAGHLLMAGALLKAWSAPRVVTSVEIDATGRKVANAQNTKVSNLAGGGTLSWTQLDEALPMPVDLNDEVVALAIKSSDFMQTLDEQPLKVAGLTGGNYKLIIDDVPAGDFSNEQLAEGINLATLNTPMVKQATEVHKLTVEHNNVHFARWRQVEVPLAHIKGERPQSLVKELMSALDEEEAAVVKRQRAASQPVEHRYELRAQ